MEVNLSDIKPNRQFHRAPECVGRKRVFSGYGEPTAAWHGTSSPTVPRGPSLRDEDRSLEPSWSGRRSEPLWVRAEGSA